MRVLVDTHALLWFGLNDARLSVDARRSIEDPGNEVLLSPATYWELAIQIGSGKISIGQDYRSFMDEQIQDLRLSILPIELEHTAVLTTLLLHHRDPRDLLAGGAGVCRRDSASDYRYCVSAIRSHADLVMISV